MSTVNQPEVDAVTLEVRLKVGGAKVLNRGIGGTQADAEALEQIIEEVLPSPQKALARLRATEPSVTGIAAVVTWLEGAHVDVLLKQICTLEQAKQLVALGCPTTGPNMAWWREWHSKEEDGTPREPHQFAQIARYHTIEKARRVVPDLFFPAWTSDELWAMFPPVSGSGPTYQSGPSRLGGWYCSQTNGKSFPAPTQAQAVAAMLIYLLKNKAKFYPVQEEGQANG
jgi:hypothetical protein